MGFVVVSDSAKKRKKMFSIMMIYMTMFAIHQNNSILVKTTYEAGQQLGSDGKDGMIVSLCLKLSNTCPLVQRLWLIFQHLAREALKEIDLF